MVPGDPLSDPPTALEEDITKAMTPGGTTALAHGDVPTSWHTRLEDVPEPAPDGYTMIIAHEFFDALPINQFECVLFVFAFAFVFVTAFVPFCFFLASPRHPHLFGFGEMGVVPMNR